MSFEHRIFGGDGADDEFGPDSNDSEYDAVDAESLARLQDVEMVESLDDLDVLADQLRDDSSHLHSQFPADQMQLLKFAEQFQPNDENDPGLGEHVDDEMQKCLQRIEALDNAERQTSRKRVVGLLAKFAGAILLAVIIAGAINQFWTPPEVSVSQNDSSTFMIPDEPAVSDSSIVALSTSLGRENSLGIEFMERSQEIDIDSLTASSESVSNDGVLLVNGDIEPVAQSTSHATTFAVPQENSQVVTSWEKRNREKSNIVPRMIARHEVSNNSSVGGYAKAGDISGAVELEASSARSNSSPAFVIQRQSFGAISSAFSGGTDSEIYGGMFGDSEAEMGMHHNRIFGAGLGAPMFDDIPEIYRSASQPEMEAIIDLHQAGQESSITIEF